MIEEIFKDVKGYEALYQVSNFGQILSLNYHRSGKPRLLKPCKSTNEYLQVNLYKNGKSKMCKIHRLVAETFISNPDNLPEVNHKDEDKTNNSVYNLEWVTAKENSNHGTRNERIAKTNTNGKKSKKVLQFTKFGELIREWPSTMECERNGYYHGYIAACCRGERNSAYGFLWKYK